ASRSVSVAQSLIGDSRVQYLAELNADYHRVRTQHANKKQVPLWPLAQARANKWRPEPVEGLAGASTGSARTELAWAGFKPTKPKFIGKRVFRNFDLAELAKYIDWGPFFQTWDLAGPYPAILTDEVVGEQATKVFADGQAMLKKIIEGRWLSANGVIGLYPANAVNDDDIALYTDDSRSTVALTWHGLRQQTEKQEVDGAMRPSRCLADFVAPKGEADDYVGLFAVTAGLGVEKKEQQFLDAHDDYSAILFKSLADRLAEAFAECLHQRVRTDLWGYAPDEALSNEELIQEKYQGIRPAPGYPACPDHSVKRAMFELLQAGNIGMTLTESLAMAPAASVSGFYLAHPQSTYFNVGKIGEDQLSDLADRSGVAVAELKRWLGPNL
ncbi:MAG: vitamin B12 dependent-methionine synthase activation domain-containing protein, partial [Hydrogenophaga sp.]